MTLARMQVRRGTAAAWTSSAAVLAAGEFGHETDTGKIKIGDGSTAWASLPYVDTTGGGGSGYIVAAATATRTAGDLSFNTTGWQNVDTGLDLVLSGVVTGDRVEYLPNFLTDATGANALAFNVSTIVSGSVVNSIGPSGASDNGLAGWYSPSATFTAVSGGVIYTLVSGDISSGSVTLRLRIRPANTTARKVLASATSPIRVSARAVH